MAQKQPLIVFETQPEPGFTLQDGPFAYEVLHVRPHVTRAGEQSMVVTWRGWCAHDGQPFTFTTGRSVWNLRRRCEEHNRGISRAWPHQSLEKGPEPANDTVAGFFEGAQMHLVRLGHGAAAGELFAFYLRWNEKRRAEALEAELSALLRD